MLLCGSTILPFLLSCFLLPEVHGSEPFFSPPASTNLICHTSHASDCYPAVFQPTEHFQRIHEDQSLPAGLHVRINLATGLKEARLNVPEPPGTPHADLVIIDDLPPRPSIEEDRPVIEWSELQDQLASDTDYQHLGQYHPNAFNTDESSLFHSSTLSLRSTAALSIADIPALSILQELAHAIHWGVALTQDNAVCQILLDAIDPGSAASNETRSAATLLLGTALHNNLDALENLLSSSHSSKAGLAPLLTVLAALRVPERGNIMLRTRTVFLLSQLCQNKEQLSIFVHSGGLTTLLDLFDPENMAPNDEKGKFRAKVANFIYDRILAVHVDADSLGTQSRPEAGGWGDDQSFLQGLEPWCNALPKALRMYLGAGMSVTNAVYESIQETNQALNEVHARLRICTNESEL